MKKFFKKYSHAWTLLYILIYIPWFIWLENNIVTNYTSIHISLDDRIPFCEYFIIPYYLWFLFVAFIMIFIFFTSKTDYYKACMFLFTGMTIFLIICTVWHNGQDLRNEMTNQTGILADLVSSLYKTDTNTNVFPSLHVFNSIGVTIAFLKSEKLKGKYYILKSFVVFLAILIILSTMFLKQHSVLDVIGAFIMAIILYIIVYIPKWKFLEH